MPDQTGKTLAGIVRGQRERAMLLDEPFDGEPADHGTHTPAAREVDEVRVHCNDPRHGHDDAFRFAKQIELANVGRKQDEHDAMLTLLNMVRVLPRIHCASRIEPDGGGLCSDLVTFSGHAFRVTVEIAPPDEDDESLADACARENREQRLNFPERSNG